MAQQARTGAASRHIADCRLVALASEVSVRSCRFAVGGQGPGTRLPKVPARNCGEGPGNG